jgi:putative hemolysin
MVDIVALDKADLTLDCIKEQARETGHSRFPVYEEKIFNMVGYVDIYDVLQRSADIEDVVDLVREPYFVPETLKISDLLTAFLKNRLPAAIVLDEHGGAVGWVTREDVLEEVVGEIEDEFDPADVNEIEVVDAITLVAKASIDIDDLNRRFNLPLPLDEEFDTLGGLVFTRLGRVPEVGDCIKESVLELTVEEMEGVKITRVRVRVLDAAPVDDEIMDDTSEDDLGMERPPRIPSFFDQQSEPNLSTPPSNT